MRNTHAILAVAMLLSLSLVLAMPLERSEADDGRGLAEQIGSAYTDGQRTEITLTGDIDLSFELGFEQGQDVVLDLAGHTLTISDKAYLITLVDGMRLTIENGTIVGGFTGSYPVLQVPGGATLVLDGVELSAASNFAVRVQSSGTLEMTGCEASCTGTYTVYNMGDTTVDGGSVGSAGITGIYHSSGSLTIGGDAQIEKITPKAAVTFESGTISAVVGSFPDGSVLDGTFLCAINGHLPSDLVAVHDEAAGVWRAEALEEDGSNAPAKLISGGVETFYGSLHAAAAAAGNGDTIVLLEDCVSDMPVTVTAFHATVDMNGHDIVNNSASSGAYGLQFKTTGLDFEEDLASQSVVVTSSVGERVSISAAKPIGISTHNSKYFIQLSIECDLDLQPADGSNKVDLGTGARILSSDEALSLITEGGFLASIGGTEYIFGSAGNALRNSDDGYAKLLNDFSGKITLNPPEGAEWVLDLNGKTVSAGNANGTVDVANGGCAVVIRDGTIVGEDGYDGILVVGYDDVRVTLENVAVRADGYYGIVTNGTNSGIEMTLAGCDITAGGMGIYFPSDGKLVLEGTTIEAPNGVQFCGSGSLEVTDCEITATLPYQAEGPYKDPEEGDGAIADGAAISMVSRGGGYQGEGETMTLTISGGTYTSNNSPIQSYRFQKGSSGWVGGDDTTLTSYLGSVDIRGGTFESATSGCPSVSYDADAEAYGIYGGTFPSGVDDDLLADGYVLDGDSVVLEGDAVASVDGTEYPTLQDAIDGARPGQTVELLADVVLDGSNVQVTQGLTIDLGGHTVTIRDTGTANVGIYFGGGSSVLTNGRIVDERAAAESSFYAVYVSGPGVSLTTSDLDILSTSSSAPEKGYYGVGIYVQGGASLTLDVGTSISIADDGAEVGTVGVMIVGTKGGTDADTYLTIREGASIEASAFAISGNGTSGYSDTSILIEGGTITSTLAQAVYHPQTGQMVVSGGTITGLTGIEIRSGTLLVTGGEIVGTGSPFSSDGNPGGSTTDGPGIAVVQHSTENPISVTVTGGSVSGYYALYEENLQDNDDSAIERIELSIEGGEFSTVGGPEDILVQDLDIIGGFVSGGTFSTDVSEYCVEGFTAGFSDGSWTVGESVTVTFVVDGEEIPVEILSGSPIGDDYLPPVGDRPGYTAAWLYGSGEPYGGEPISEDTILTLDWALDAPAVEVEVSGTLYEGGTVTVSVTAGHELDGVGYAYYLVDEDTGVEVWSDSPEFEVSEPGRYHVRVVASIGGDTSEASSGTFEITLAEPEVPPFIPAPDDDDDFLPPVVTVPEEDGVDDGGIGIVAVVAAVVAAAIIAVFLAAERKR